MKTPARGPTSSWLFRILLPTLLTVGLFVVILFVIGIPMLEDLIFQRQRTMIRMLTESAWSVLAHQEEKVRQGALSLEEAQEAARQEVRAMRYGPRMKDYFWINDMRPRMVMHPYSPELEGQDLAGYADPDGKRLFMAFVEVVKASGAGYVDYRWQWKDDPTRVVPKLSFVKGFPPWGWIIGTGIYIEDVGAEIARFRRKTALASSGVLLVVLAMALIVNHQGLQADRRRSDAEARLRRSEASYRSLVENIDLGITRVDRDHNVLMVNEAQARLVGKAPEDLVGKKCYESLHGRTRVCTGCAGIPAAPSGRPQEIETEGRDPDGRPRHLRTRSFPSLDEEGEVSGFIDVMEDITDRRRTEEERGRLEARLRESQRIEAIGTLAGGIAHDFNNILAVIFGYAEMAQLGVPPDSDAHQKMDWVLKAAYRARDLVKQILTFSRQNEQESKPVEIGLMVKEGLRLVRASLPSTIQIRSEIHAGPLTVLADPTQVYQVLMNLCTNAGHAMRAVGGRLDVSVTTVRLEARAAARLGDLRPGSYVRLSVADTGHGMDPETQERIFEPYFTTKPKGEGTGLGLAVVHGIVKRHHGTVQVRSTAGSGTTVNVLLPRLEEPAPDRFAAPGPPPRGQGHILLVDDEEEFVAIGTEMLQSLGYDVTPGTSSLEALGAFRVQPDRFDAVVTDRTMPDMTGDALARELLRIRPDLPIILCTGFSEQVTEQAARSMGIRAFVLKPLVLYDLARTLREVLEGEPWLAS